MTLKQILRLLVVILGLLVLLGTTVFLVLRWSGIPEQIPAHFAGAGHIDGYESKDSLIGLLVLAWVFWLLMIVLARVPRLLKQNGGFMRVNAIRFGGTKLEPTPLSLELTALALALLFGYLTLCSALCRNLGGWFLPVSLIAVLLAMLVPSLLERSN